MANYKRWSNAEKDFIRENCGTHSDKEIAKRMGKLVERR